MRGVSVVGVDERQRVRVRAVFQRFGIDGARRDPNTDPTEEVFLISAQEMARVGEASLTYALLEELPGVKVWVVTQSSAWTSEEI